MTSTQSEGGIADEIGKLNLLVTFGTADPVLLRFDGPDMQIDILFNGASVETDSTP